MVHQLSDKDWNSVVQNLRRLRLIAPPSYHNLGGLDAHPLIREHFAQHLRQTNEKSWKQGHSHLYEYLKMSAPRFPDTLEEMQPLFAAVTHGCLAEKHQQSFDDVYLKRIRRVNEAYSVKKLGAFGADLAALSAFCEKPWTKPASALTDYAKALVLIYAGYALRALGRLTESIQPMKGGLKPAVGQENWKNAARAACNLSELYLALGDMQQAVDYAQQSADFADKSGEEFERYTFRTTLADALHNSGQLAKAKELFDEAEKMQKDHTPGFPYLYSIRGFNFCDLLLAQGKYKQVQDRAIQTITIAQRNQWLLAIALDKLSFGRAYLLQTLHEKTGDFTQAEDLLNQAVSGLRKSGDQDMLSMSLLNRAELWRANGRFTKAGTDLDEAKEIAERGQMKLYIADYHLEAARLSLAEGNKQNARDNYDKAQALVNETGYHLRDPELLLIKAGLEIADGDKGSASKTLTRAEECIKKMTAHRWNLDLSQLQQKLT